MVLLLFSDRQTKMPGEKNVDVEKKTSRARETTDVEAGK